VVPLVRALCHQKPVLSRIFLAIFSRPVRHAGWTGPGLRLTCEEDSARSEGLEPSTSDPSWFALVERYPDRSDQVVSEQVDASLDHHALNEPGGAATLCDAIVGPNVGFLAPTRALSGAATSPTGALEPAQRAQTPTVWLSVWPLLTGGTLGACLTANAVSRRQREGR
jgi:hypothetical protein